MAINREKVLEAAQKFYEKKKYDKALFEYQKIIQEDPNDARILLKVGDLQSKMEAYADAVATYEKVGKFYAAQGFALKAIAVYKQIRELIAKHVPQLEDRYGHIAPKLAELYQQLGLVSDALAALDEVATKLQRQGKDREAIETFRKVVELDPTNPLPHLRLAEALSRGQDIEGAVEEFNLAAGLLVNLGRRDDAIKVYERLLHHRLDPEKARKAAELYLSRGQPNDGMQALAKLQICFQADPKNLDTLQLLAHAFFAIGQASKAIEVQKEMARIARDSGDTALFTSIVNRLRQQAPNDETVVRMAASTNLHASTAPVGFEPRQAPPPPPPPRAMPTATMNVPNPFNPQQQQPQPQYQPPPPMRPPTMSAPEVHEVSYSSVPPEELEELESYEDAEDFQAQQLEEEQRQQDEHDLAHARQQQEQDGHEYRGAPSMPPPSPGTAARVAQILADAASFRRVRLYKKAIDTLRGGIELDPRSLELYETLRQVLYEARQEDQSIDVGLRLAALYVDALDGDSAARVLQDVLALDPHHPRALEMLHELGYELAPEEDEDAPQVGDTTDSIQLPAGIEDYGEPQSDPSHGALPSYDLEEMGPRDVSQRYDQQRRITGRPVTGAFDAVDDPFLSEAPLPSFPLDQTTGEQAAFGDRTEYSAFQHTDGHAGAEAQDAQASAHTANTAFPAPVPSQSPEALEDALEEADFFASRGLYADARTILHDQLARHPNHPLLLERMAELDDSEAAAGGGDNAEAYAMALDDLEAAPAAGGFTSATQQVDVEEVFSKFKEGVARQISIDDAQSHYDLGVAYKEMGLIDDAIREFETAARDETRETICLSMVGMIELERGNVEQALEAFLRGVNSRGRQPDQEMVLCFEIGACYELQNMNSEALGYYQRVLRRDSRYRDVEARVRRLTAATGGNDQSQVRSSSGGDEDFERAFEDLLDEG